MKAARLIEVAGEADLAGRNQYLQRNQHLHSRRSLLLHLRFLTGHAAVPVSSGPPPRCDTPRQSATTRPPLISLSQSSGLQLPVPGPKQAGSRGENRWRARWTTPPPPAAMPSRSSTTSWPSPPLPNRRARRASGVSRMVYTGFINTWPSRFRMWSTPMRTRTIHRVAVPHQLRSFVRGKDA